MGNDERVSQFSKHYDPMDNRRKFDEFLQSTRSIGLGSFFYKCQEYGVIPPSVPHYDMVPFPVEVFPKQIRDIIAQTHQSLNFTVDHIAASLLFTASVIGTIQPGLLYEFAKGKTESGFVDRWLFAYPDDSAYPKLTKEQLPKDVTRTWCDIIERIYTLPFTEGTKHFKLTRDAMEVYSNYFRHISHGEYEKRYK